MTTSTKKNGFTLIEAIVGITILTLAVVGPLTLAAQSLKATRGARQELEATHLAAEAFEVVHSIRDNNSAHDSSPTRTAWMQNIMSNCSNGDGCIIDVTDHSSGVWGNNTLLACPAGNCASVSTLYFYPSTSLYNQSLSPLPSPWVDSQFKRFVKVVGIDDPVNPMQQVHVVVTVTYDGVGGTRTVSIADDMYNWFPELQ